MTAPILKVDNSTKYFGGLTANDHISFEMQEGEVIGLIGPNGAGKTTLFNCIAGFMHPEEGSVTFKSTDTTNMRPEYICKLGIARTWQIVRTFVRMTALENVICGALNRTNTTHVARRRALELMEFTGLAGKENVTARNLTLADKKRLEITRALATEPRLLLLDEAMSGLTPSETAAAVDLVRRIHRELNMTIILVEHVLEVVMPLSQRLIVLDYGVKIADGPPEVVSRDEKVIKAYLGEHYSAAS